jgi:cytochrome b561
MCSGAATSEDAASLKGRRFDDVAISLHWVTLALLVAQFSSAWLLAIAHGDQAAALLEFHRSLGIVIWLVTVCRFAWRKLFAYLPPFPDSMPMLQQKIAKANEYGLYAFLILQPLSGLAYTLFRGRAFPLFFFQTPAILPGNRAVADFFHQVHEIGATALLLLIGAHALAALFHRFVLKDEILERMLPASISRRR